MRVRWKKVRRFLAKLALLLLMTASVGWCVRDLVLDRWNEEESWIVRLETQRPHPETAAERAASENPDDPNWQVEKIDAFVTFLTGPERGMTRTLTVEQLEGSYLDLIPGREYLLMRDRYADGIVQWSVADRFRLPWVVMSILFVCGCIALSTGISGVRALIGLGLSLIYLTRVFLPMVIAGYSPVWAAVLAVVVSSIITVTMVVRRRWFWPVALIGSIGGALAAFFMGWISIELWQLSGMTTESGALVASVLPGIDIRGIFLAAVIIGATGALHDVAISISSALAELADYDSCISLVRLWRMGMNVGREILGSMVDTLVLAYFGGSLFTVLLIAQAQPQWHLLFNDAQIAQEIVQSLAGTLGLLLTVPITTFCAIWWTGRRRKSQHSRWR